MAKEKILVTGASGLVGSRFCEIFREPARLLTPDLAEFELTRPESIAAYFADHPDIGSVVHLAAYTNVGQAQKQKADKASLCYQINVIGTENLVNQIKDKDIYLIHISTDMVFPGDAADPGPYAENYLLEPDPNRLTWYGYTKALAEKYVRAQLPSAAILRFIYPVTARYEIKLDYLRSPLAYYEKNGTLYPIFTDQQMNLTDVDEIAEVIAVLIARRLPGTFHAASSDITTPYAIMSVLFDQVYGRHDMVRPGSLSEFLRTQTDPSRYPRFGGLLIEKTATILGKRYSDSTAIVKRLHPPSIG